MKISSELVNNISDIYDEPGKQWLSSLPNQLQRLAEQWGFEFVEPIKNLTYSFVAQVKGYKESSNAIIKIAPDLIRLKREVDAFRSFSSAVPVVYEFDEAESAFLMEALTPGNSLKDLVITGEDDKATRIIAETIMQLHHLQKIEHRQFKQVSELAEDLNILEGHVKPILLEKARSYFRNLSQDCKNDVLLHGDLHHDNILLNVNTWVAIDPHGYRGDPAFEVGAMIRNPYDYPDYLKANTIKRRLDLLCELLPYDPHRIKAWAFSVTILSLAWSFEGYHKIPALNLEITTIIDRECD